MVNIFGSWLVMACMTALHPFFVSLTDINYNKTEKELEIIVRIFTDDFENTLRKNNPGLKIDVLHPANQQQLNQLVSSYIQKHLQFQLNGKAIQLSFIGYEQQAESIWTYFEVKQVSSVEKLAITNSLLHDYNTNQINMMHIKVSDKEQSTKLDYPEEHALFSF